LEADKIIAELRQSNVDRRSLAIVEDMHEHLAQKSNVVRIGITNIALEGVMEDITEMAAPAISARIKAFHFGVRIFVSQFDEWHTFLDQSADADVTPEAVRDAKSVARSLADEFRARPQLVSPEVPLSIELILEAYKSPRTSAKRLTFALVRSIENIVSSILSSALEIKNKALEGVGIGTKRGVAIAMGTGLVALAVGAAHSIAPTATRVLDTNWMQSAVKVIEKELSKPD
jgi:hypothetical protein